jgi:hypothetical protein
LDKLLIATVFVILCFLGLQRLDYAGDGMLHLYHILQSNYPRVGEPRWLLFPLLLFLVVKPLALAGLIHTTDQAAKVFAIFNVILGTIYLICLRRWLSDFPASRRAAVLLLVAASYVFLVMATDTIEPTLAAVIAVIGLTFARFHPGLSDRVRLTAATATLALASLVYQGLLFGLFFLPAIFPWSLLTSRQMLLRIAMITLTVPCVVIILLSLTGDSPWNAARRFAQGEANVMASNEYSKISLKNVIGVTIVGPTYAFASIPELRGLSGSLKLLRARETALDGIRGVAAWSCMAAAIAFAIIVLALRKEFKLLFAYAGMLMLPMIRMNQYGYPKYYVLLPLLVVLAVPRLGISFIFWLLGGLLFVSNTTQIYAEISQSKLLRSEVARDLYPQIPHGTCFLTNGWKPSVPGPNHAQRGSPVLSDWDNNSVAWPHIIYAGNMSQRGINIAQSEQLRLHLTNLFCTCSAVVTDSFIEPNLITLQQELSNFGIVNIPISQLVVPFPEIFRSSKFSVYRFSDEDRERACNALMHARMQ